MTTLSSSNRASISYLAETNFGVTPGTGSPAYLRFTGESFDFALTKTASSEIRQDRQKSGTTTVNAAASGALNFETQYREYDALIAGALQSSYSVYGTAGIGTSFTADFAANTITASVAPTGSSAFTTLQKGQWFRLTTGGANNGKFFRVSSTVAPTSTVITLDASTAATVATGVTTCAIQTSRLTNGTTMPTFTIEKAFNDVGQFFTYRGMGVNKMNLKFASGALSTGSFDFMGKDLIRATATAMPSTPAASQTFSGQNGVRGVGQLWEGSTPLTGTFLKQVDITLDNNLRAQDALANLGAIGLGVGSVKTTGTFDAYFADGTQFDKFLNDQYTALTVGTQDTSGNGYIITLPRVMLTTVKVMASGENQDVMAQFGWEAYADLGNATAALQQTIFIDRVGA